MSALVRASIWIPILLVVVWKFLQHTRVYDLERQDMSEEMGRYTRKEYVDLMHMLAEASLADPNGHNATMESFEQLSIMPSSIMEIGFGLGHFSIMLAEKYPNCTIVGIDAHELSVYSANEYLHSLPLPPINVRFESRQVSQLNETAKSVDIITTNMVNHHIFPDEEFVGFLKRVAIVGKHAFIFNDFYRSLRCIVSNDINMLALKYIGMETVAKLSEYLPKDVADSAMRYNHIFTKERHGSKDLAAEGGMLSMRRSFSLEEYKRMFHLAGYPEEALQCRVLNKWYETVEATCKVVCTADLTWHK